MATGTPRVWLVRAGRHGERASWALDNQVAGGGFKEVDDLTRAATRDAVAGLVRAAFPDAKANLVANYAGQLWALRERITVGDIVVMPMKTSGQIAIGKVVGGYRHLTDPDPERRHVRPVQWLRTDVPRTAIKQDLLYTLGAFLTICEVSRNDGAWRMAQVLESGHDPGSRPALARATLAAADVPQAGDVEADASPAVDVERYARDRITSTLIEHYAGHKLEHLVAAVLRAEGFACTVTKASGDGGVDVFAGRGPFGLDSPRLVVQVKSDANPVGVDVVQKLQGALSSHGADQALLVAWGGLNGNAQALLINQHFRIRVWDADDLIDAVCRNYLRLPDEIRAELPLKQVWVLVEEDAP
ncbi:restriction endonuclease [Micromonospora echinofusca]|uniref:restriction endonuclease n=1 Tax=Micromonospora echinofusca TaxID=47858 RepID=UPI00379F0A77